MTHRDGAAPSIGRPTESFARRVGTYATFAQLMLDRLHTQSVPDSDLRPPMASMQLHTRDDLVPALVRSWAAVGDVLSFYQERIANEGYIGSAVEERSVRELARMIGYQPRAGIAGLAYLAFSVASSRGIVRELTVPAGTRVQSLPGPGERPQVFETMGDLPVRAEWSELKAAPARPPAPGLAVGATQVYVLGTAAQASIGDPLLIFDPTSVDASGIPTRWLARVITAIEPRPAQARTLVSWSEPVTEAEGAPFVSADAMCFRHSGRLFGHDAPDWSSLSDEQKRRAAPRVGRVFISADSGDHWQATPHSLPTADIVSLVVDAAGRTFAATLGSGVLRSLDGGVNWHSASAGLSRRDVHALALDRLGFLLAGTAGGVYRSTDGGASWQLVRGSVRLHIGLRGSGLVNTSLPQSVVNTLVSYVDPRTGVAYLFAGTNDGVARTLSHEQGWQAVNEGLPAMLTGAGESSVVVRALTVHRDSHYLYAGTSQGVFASTDHGDWWMPVNDGLPSAADDAHPAPADVAALLSYTDPTDGQSYIFAALADGGIYRSIGPETAWTAVNQGFPATMPAAHALAVGAGGGSQPTCIYAASKHGLFRSEDHGATWVSMSSTLATLDVQAVTTATNGHVIAAVPDSAPTSDDWPGFGLSGDAVELDRAYAGLSRRAWVLLEQQAVDANEDGPIWSLRHVADVTRENYSAFSKRAIVTRLRFAPGAGDLGQFDRRQASVFFDARRLRLTEPRVPIVQGDTLLIAQRLHDALEGGRTAVVSGSRIRVRMVRDGQSLEVQHGDPITLEAGDELEVMRAPDAQPDGTLLWTLRHGGRLIGTARLAPGDAEWASAGRDDEVVSELIHILTTGPGDEPGQSRLALDAPLQHLYDGATFELRANVAIAAHGETVVEVLGSGDFSRANQSFALKRPALLWVMPPGASEPMRTVSVHVNGVRWREVEALDSAGPRDACYVVEAGEVSGARIVFGDGVHGARLPTGSENVEAIYRTGRAEEGVAVAHSLVHLLGRPLGVRGVTNPLPASGATAAESTQDLRWAAPRSLRQRERVISLGDFAEFALAYPGVTKAAVRVVYDGRRAHVQLTFAGAPDSTSDADEALADALGRAIDGARAMPHRLHIQACARVAFELKVHVRCTLDASIDDLAARSRQRLKAAFAFERRGLSQPVVASEIVRCLHEVPGVAAIDIGRLAFVGAAADAPVPARLEAAVAGIDPATRKPRPAELLLLDMARVEIETSRAAVP